MMVRGVAESVWDGRHFGKVSDGGGGGTEEGVGTSGSQGHDLDVMIAWRERGGSSLVKALKRGRPSVGARC